MRTATKALLERRLDAYGPDTAENLAAELGLTKRSVNRALAELHGLQRVYIASYEPAPRGPAVRVWAFGYGVDVKAPRRQPGHLRMRALRERQAATTLDGWLRGATPL